MLDVRWNGGIHVGEAGLWLDPRRPRDHAFVSRAHSDHIARHRQIIASPGTHALLEARLPRNYQALALDFGVPHQLGAARITLCPAGHVLGSAQIHLEHEAGSLLYTGDFKLRPGRAAEQTTWMQAETLVMETTFGLPAYRLPPTDEVVAQLVAFCRDALDAGDVPIAFGYSLGKAQEILCALGDAGLPVALHPSAWKLTRIYQRLQPGMLPPFEKYKPGETGGKVLVFPPNVNRPGLAAEIPNRRTVMLTGWAIHPSARYRYGCDLALPLSDHADYPDLLRYVELVQPRRVITVHGYAREFAADLRRRGIDARALGLDEQLELDIPT